MTGEAILQKGMLVDSQHGQPSTVRSAVLFACPPTVPSRPCLLSGLGGVVGADGRFEGFGIGADHLGDLLAVAEEEEGGHGLDAQVLRDVFDLVDVDLVERGFGELVREPGAVSASPVVFPGRYLHGPSINHMTQASIIAQSSIIHIHHPSSSASSIFHVRSALDAGKHIEALT